MQNAHLEPNRPGKGTMEMEAVNTYGVMIMSFQKEITRNVFLFVANYIEKHWRLWIRRAILRRTYDVFMVLEYTSE